MQSMTGINTPQPLDPFDRLPPVADGHRRQPVGGFAKRAQDLVGLALDCCTATVSASLCAKCSFSRRR